MTNVPKPLEGRDLHTQQVSYLRRDLDHVGAEEPFMVGVLPPGALIIGVKVFVKTAFTGAKFKFGTTTEVNDLLEADVGQIGVKLANVAATKWAVDPKKEMLFYAKLDKKVNQGSGSIVVLFVTDN